MTTFKVDPLTNKRTPVPDDYRADVELDRFILDVVNNTKKLKDIDIASRIISGEIEQTMEGASNITVTLRDLDGMTILNSGIFDRKIDVTVDGLRYRLAAVNKNDQELDLIFEDVGIAYLRGHKEVVTTSRNMKLYDGGRLTRAEFCVYLVRRVKLNNRLAIVCPELEKAQPIQSDRKDIKKVKRSAGIANGADLKVKYADGSVRRANNAQINLAEEILDVGTKMKASFKVLASAIAAVMIESGMTNPEGGDRDSVGAFQQRRSQGWPASRDISIDAKAYFEVAIQKNRDSPGLSLGNLAAEVQRPQANLRYKYDTAAKYAKEFVQAYGSASFTTVAYRKRFVFSTENDHKAEDWWTAIKRLMDEVNWAAFMSNGTLYLIAEEDLIKSKARAKLSESTPGVDRINFTYDVGQPIASATVICRAERWIAPPGTVVILEDCGPANGRWLVSTLRRSLFSRDLTIELKKADHSLKEPASEIVERAGSDEAVSEHRGSVDPNERSGKVKFTQNANRPGVPMRKPILDFLKAVAGQTSEDILVICGTNHNQFVAGSTNQSDHWTGDAADINVDGTATGFANLTQRSSNKGDNIAIAAMKVCGIPYAQAKRMIPGDTQFNHSFTWKGHNVQIGWKTGVGGNHFNHVHLGCEP